MCVVNCPQLCTFNVLNKIMLNCSQRFLFKWFPSIESLWPSEPKRKMRNQKKKKFLGRNRFELDNWITFLSTFLENFSILGWRNKKIELHLRILDCYGQRHFQTLRIKNKFLPNVSKVRLNFQEVRIENPETCYNNGISQKKSFLDF